MNTYASDDLKAVKVGTPDRIVWEIDIDSTVSTLYALVHEAWALLSPVDCSYTLVFEDGEQGSTTISVFGDCPNTDEEKAKFLALFATHDKVTIEDLTAVEPKPEGPYCIYEEEEDVLGVRAGTNKWRRPLGVTIYKRNLNTADIAALCNPHKCEARVRAATENESLILYCNLGTVTPEEMLKYDRFSLISVRGKEQ